MVFEPSPALLVAVAAALAVCGVAILRGALPRGSAVAWASGAPGDRRAWLLTYAAALAASAPLLRHAPFLLGPDALLVSDASSHAAIALAIARDGLPHGWVATYNGGFPLGPHYPPLPYLLMAGLIRAGLSARVAVQSLGLLGAALLPLAFVAAGRRVGARPVPTLAAALLVAWLQPYHAALGGWATYLTEGLLAQALALPLAVWLAAVLAAPTRRTWVAPLLAATLEAVHPQIATVAAVATVAASLAGSSALRGRVVVAWVAAAAIGAALYVPGIRTLGLAFYPTQPAWKQLGYPPRELAALLLEGDLFDVERAPAATIAIALATIAALAMVRSRACRGLLLATLATLAIAGAGTTLAGAGAWGRALVSFFIPLRAIAVLGLLGAAAVLVAGSELGAHLERHATSPRATSLRRAGAWALITALAAVALPARARWIDAFVAQAVAMRPGTGNECGTMAPRGLARGEVAAWVARYDGARLALDVGPPFANCLGLAGIPLASHVPLGLSVGAYGHMGVLTRAFESFVPSSPGSAARAEALGVRGVLAAGARQPQPDQGWRVVAESGAFALFERASGTDLVGVGCVEQSWRGDVASLRGAVEADLASARSALDTPTRLVALEVGTGPLLRAPIDRAGCDAASASVVERPREPGAYEATIESPSPVDVVFRATSFPSWRVTIDGVAAPTRTVEPAWFSVRVPPGRHQVVAQVAPPAGYLGGLAAALLVVAAMALASAHPRLRGDASAA